MSKTADFLFLLFAFLLVIFAAYAGGNFLTENYSESGTKTSQNNGFSSSTYISPPVLQPAAGGASSYISPYAGKVLISSVIPGFPGFQNTKYSQIHLYTAGITKGEFVNITRWKVTTNRGASFIIPQGSMFYHSSTSPQYGDIILDSYDYVYIYSHAPPYHANFRINQCSGYHEGFDPSFSNQCPKIQKSEISHLIGACQNYLLSLQTCQIGIPIPHDLRYAAGCYEAAQKLNYDDCYNMHKNDPGFFSNEWRIWLGPPGTYQQINIFDLYHDKVQLLDENGRLVDEYVY